MTSLDRGCPHDHDLQALEDKLQGVVGGYVGSSGLSTGNTKAHQHNQVVASGLAHNISQHFCLKYLVLALDTSEVGHRASYVKYTPDPHRSRKTHLLKWFVNPMHVYMVLAPQDPTSNLLIFIFVLEARRWLNG